MSSKFAVGYAIEQWDLDRTRAVKKFLQEAYGDDGLDSEWFIDIDFDLRTLCLTESALMITRLKFPWLK